MLQHRYRHIIWDWNGTLLDDLELTIDIMNGLLRPRKLPLLDRSRYHALFDFPVRKYYEKLGFDLVGETFEQLSVEFIEAYDRRRWEARLHAGAEDLLRDVLAAGVSQSILSAYRHSTLCEIVEHFGLTSRFVRLNGLDNIYAHSKVELGRAWVAELALAPDQILLVGDTLHDFEVAEALGIDCVLVANGHHPAERLRARTTDVFTTLSAFRTVFNGGRATPSNSRAGSAAFADRESPAG
jgi:phosphoglycolate phosphatase